MEVIGSSSIADVINDICPWSGEPVSADALTTYRGHTVGFCNPGCRDKFEKAVGMFDTAISEKK
ncbi:MAG: glutathione S-transferase [Pseudomonadota bacterium]